MRPSELAKMFELEDTYWWFVARRRLVRELLVRHLRGGRRACPPLAGHIRPTGGVRVLDVGCGTGATLATLAEFGEVTGLDRSPEALRFCRRRGHHRLVLARGEELPVMTESVDVITALDLLEHIPDDAAAMREFARALRPGGLLVVTVPAGPWLWSEHDEALDHLRRYRAPRLREIMEDAGLEIVRLSPLITMLLAPIAALRLLQKLQPREASAPQTAFIIPPRWINTLLVGLLWLENRWLLRWNLPAGVSLMAVAEKAAGGAREGGVEENSTRRSARC
jgi:SAM-dependent methyltransferase